MSRRTKAKGKGKSLPAGGEPVRVNLISLGCPKNLVDSEMILGQVGSAGLSIATRPEDADVIVINTCSFIDSAKEESINTILAACEVKKRSRTQKRVVVTGCLAQRYGQELRREVPEVDAIIGLGQYDGIGGLLKELAESDRDRAGRGRDGEPDRQPVFRVDDPNRACTAEVGRFRLTPRHYAYLRISEGCDNPCTFCSIPSFRGRFRSKPIPAVEEEVRELAASGAEEIVIISQDTTSYGLDLDGKFQLPRLLERVASVEGVRWVRVLYVYPACFSDEMIDAVAGIDKVLKYIDVPIQHIDDRMLRRMGRRMNEADTRRLLGRMRERIPGLYLRTTFIVGFPGEEEREFQNLLDFAGEFRFERMGVFAYSREEGTPAARMAEEVPAKTVRSRMERLMLAQQEVAFAQNHSRVGQSCEVLIDGREGGKFHGRSYGEAPEIDPRIFLADPGSAAPRPAAERRGGSPAAGADREELPGIQELAVLGPPPAVPPLEVGRFVRAVITGTRGYDLLARPVAPVKTEPAAAGGAAPRASGR
jgi:ribosomal protein S12 methylthiotransferase